MSKHTPGPWHQSSYQVEADDGSLICHMSGWRGPKFTEANARLIAAAPELLAALEWMVAHDDTNEGDDPVESLGGQTWNEYNAYWLAGLEQARAAIAKAKGETP